VTSRKDVLTKFAESSIKNVKKLDQLIQLKTIINVDLFLYQKQNHTERNVVLLKDHVKEEFVTTKELNANLLDLLFKLKKCHTVNGKESLQELDVTSVVNGTKHVLERNVLNQREDANVTQIQSFVKRNITVNIRTEERIQNKDTVVITL